VLDRDSTSLLNLHRKLIHLRTAHPVLGSGEFVALNASSGMLAYLRRSGSDAVLVVSNLTNLAISQPGISAGTGVLPPGRYALRALYGGARDSELQIRNVFSIRALGALQRIGPYETHIFQLSRQN
jgi:hypothetical protein